MLHVRVFEEFQNAEWLDNKMVGGIKYQHVQSNSF